MQQNQTPKFFGLSAMRALAAFAAILGVIGMFLPWVDVNVNPALTSASYVAGSSLKTVSTNSVYTGLLSIIALVIIFSDRIQAIFEKSISQGNPNGSNASKQLSSANVLVKAWSNVILLILGVVVVLLAWDTINQINTFQQAYRTIMSGYIDTYSGYTAGIGLWLTIVAGLLIVVSIVLSLVMYQERLIPATSRACPVPAQFSTPGSQSTMAQPPASVAASQAFCPFCGSKLEGSAFCTKCGNKVK